MNSNVKRTLRLILNGKSAGEPAIRDAVKQLRDGGFDISVRVTWEFGDAERYTKEAAQDQVDVVVAGGGDGTINEVTGGMLSSGVQYKPAIGVLPLGTANDFARGCGIPVGDPLAALQFAGDGPIHAIDVGEANGRHFINVASGGFGAEVTANTPPELKKAIGGAAYSIMGIVTAAKMTPHHCTVTLADGTKRQGQMFAMAVGNSIQCGGGQQLTPHAFLDDGLLDLMVVHDVDLQSFGTILGEMSRLQDKSNRNISYVQAESFKIESDRPVQVNLDGEPMRHSSYVFRAIPKALRFVLPETAPLTATKKTVETDS